MAKASAENKPGQHKATYARDKRNGGYIIRVEGPNAPRFAGREVPLLKKGETSPSSNETLTDLIWSGLDSESGKPVALYHFAAKPREELNDEIPF